MSSWISIILLTFLQLLAGMGLVSLFKIRLKPAMLLSLWLLTGVIIFSLIPFLLQLAYIPLTAGNIAIALVASTLLLNIPYKRNIAQVKSVFQESHFRITLYEIPFLFTIAFLVFVSVWRCFYFPPYPRDLTSGAEVIAEYAVREKTMINSVFSVNLETTNNQFKPPFITSLQIIYKYAGFPFGQVWLSTIFICFLVFLYHAISATIHRLLAGLLLIVFICMPEMYAYTFMALFDYSNAVFFFLSVYFIIRYLDSGEKDQIAFAGLLMGFATYIRSETLILTCLLAPLLAWHSFRHRRSFLSLLVSGVWLLLPPVLFYVLSITLYVNHYLPATYSIAGLINTHLLNLQPLKERFLGMNKELIFSKWGIQLYGYYFFIFLLILLLDLLLSFKSMTRHSLNWLYAVLIIYLGMPLLGFILPLMDIDNTTKRGLFKIFPLMLLYMSTSTLLVRLSDKIKKWEAAR